MPQATQGWSEQAYGATYTQVRKILWERYIGRGGAHCAQSLTAMKCLIISENNISLISTTDRDEERTTRKSLCIFLAASRTRCAPGKSFFVGNSFPLQLPPPPILSTLYLSLSVCMRGGGVPVARVQLIGRSAAVDADATGTAVPATESGQVRSGQGPGTGTGHG
jgi:hypothetical protein